MQNKLWGGRFSAEKDADVDLFSASVDVDRRLALVDIQGSIVHARMLARCNIITSDEALLIENGLSSIAQDIQQGRFEWSRDLEDVHMNIEAALVKRIGVCGKKLHTARSRNDQVSTSMRLYLRESLDEILDLWLDLMSTAVNRAEEHVDTIMPGFTHMQSAQPIVVGHHLLAWFEMLWRDYERLKQTRGRLNQCPLGAAALAGSGFAIDRNFVADELGFDQPTRNSIDSVSDRDFIIEFVGAASLAMVHFSRMCEEVVLWSTTCFDFAAMSESLCTGSSIMPQKRNPDIAELIRGKCARITGHHAGLLVLMKSQPLAYNRDNQEDKIPLFDTIDTLKVCAEMMVKLISGLQFNVARLRYVAAQGFSTATDLADYLVAQGTTFRDAHAQVGAVVRYCIDYKKDLDQLSLDEIKSLCPDAKEDVHQSLSVEGSVARRNHVGGTAPLAVKKALKEAHQMIADAKA